MSEHEEQGGGVVEDPTPAAPAPVAAPAIEIGDVEAAPAPVVEAPAPVVEVAPVAEEAPAAPAQDDKHLDELIGAGIKKIKKAVHWSERGTERVN